MEQSNKKIIIISIILAIITSTLIYIYLTKIQVSNNNIEYINVIIASKTIDAKSIISSEDLKSISIQKSLLNKNALLDKIDIINKINKETIYEGEQILKDRLADNNNASLAYQIPQGKRAISINVNEASSVGFFIKPGDFIDVILTLQKESEEQKEGQIISPRMSKILLQNIMVLGVGKDKDIIQNAGDKKDLKNSTASADNIKTITLALTQEETEKITIGEEAGILKLALRPVGDNNTIISNGITRNELVPQEKKYIFGK